MPTTPYQDPQLILQTSNDGGKTWGPERPRSLGQLGNYQTLVKWNQLGRSNNRAHKFVWTEPVKLGLVGADLDVELETP